MKARINTEGLLQYVAFFCLFFYPFNNTIMHNLPFGKYLAYLMPIAGMISLLFLPTRKQKRKTILQFAALCFVSMAVLFRNQYILEGFQTRTFFIQAIYILTAIIIAQKKIEYRIMFNVVALFCLEHIIGTIIPIIAPGLYSDQILPFICKNNAECEAIRNFMIGVNPGLTSHYSTNAAYMSISAILFSSRFFSDKKKNNLCFLIISILLLFVIGKRAHLIFVILTILAGYLFSINAISDREKISIIAKGTAVLLISVALLFMIGTRVPSVYSTINRITSSLDSKNELLNGREALYELAILNWAKSPIIGNGVGSYIKESNDNFSIRTYGHSYMHAHNDYLEILSDLGLIGLMLYVGFLIMLFRKCIQSHHDETCCPCEIHYSYQYLIFYSLYSFTGTPMSLIPTFAMFVITCSIIINIEESKQ